MFPMTKFPLTVLALFTVAYTCACATGAPLVGPRDVFVPPILYPNAHTIWVAGQRHNVTWDASNPPKLISNRASIVLRTVDVNSGFSWVTLAANFSLLDGRHEIHVPTNVATREDYQIILFGDSGNTSPPFTIFGQRD